METILSNTRVLLPFALILWALVFLGCLTRPQRYLNSLLLLAALGGTLLFIAGLFGDYMSTAVLVMAGLVTLILLCVPAMLIINGIVMVRREGKCLAHLLSLLLGIVIFVGELAFFVLLLGDLVNSTAAIRIPVSFVFSTVMFFSILILAFVVYMLFIQITPRRRRFDYVVIHGCGLLDGERVSTLLSNRLVKAIAVYEASAVKPILIASGGKGEDEKVSEAAAMAAYLRTKGIPDDHIWEEDGSVDTLENLANCKKLIDAAGGKPRTALVTSNYHVYRCLLYARRMKMRVTGVGAAVAPYYWPSAVLREFVAVFSRRPHVIWIILCYIFFIVLPTVTMLMS